MQSAARRHEPGRQGSTSPARSPTRACSRLHTSRGPPRPSTRRSGEPVQRRRTAAALHRALPMDEAERRSRVAAVRRRERRDDVLRLGRAISRRGPACARRAARRPPAILPNGSGRFSPLGYRLALFLAFDRTPGSPRERRAHPRLSAGARRVLEDLDQRADSDVTIASGGARTAVATLEPHAFDAVVGRDRPGSPAPVAVDRGQAVLHLLRTRYGTAWSESVRVVYVGADDADEAAFRLFAGLAFTFRGGQRRQPDVRPAPLTQHGRRRGPVAMARGAPEQPRGVGRLVSRRTDSLRRSGAHLPGITARVAKTSGPGPVSTSGCNTPSMSGR